MIIKFEGREIDTNKVRQLYPAAMIETGYKDELTQISLEWYDTEEIGDIKAKKYAIFFHFDDKKVETFYYKSREELEEALLKLSQLLN